MTLICKKLLPVRGTRLNNIKLNVNVFMKKVIPRSVRANLGKNWAKLTRYASCTSSL